MKIAITSMGGSLEAQVSEQFGRCPYFVIYDTESKSFAAISNLGEQMQSAAGPKAAETIIAQGAEVLLTGHVGDKAEAVLIKANIKIVDGFTGSLKVKDAIGKFLN